MPRTNTFSVPLPLTTKPTIVAWIPVCTLALADKLTKRAEEFEVVATVTVMVATDGVLHPDASVITQS